MSEYFEIKKEKFLVHNYIKFSNTKIQTKQFL